MTAPKPVDNCILYIERRIRELEYQDYEALNSFSAGLLLGIEAGIKQANGEFEINMLEAPRENCNHEKK